MKYKIYLDTNQVFSNKGPLCEPFNLSIPDLRKFLDEKNIKNVEICLPDIVVRERIQHKIENINKSLEDVNKLIRSLNSVGHESEEIEATGDYQKILEKNATEFLEKNKVIRISAPSIGKEELIDRAINKMKPFNDKGAGFKDTLIFLSIIEDALNADTAADRYIFCTNDSDEFTEEVIKEFEECTHKELYLVSHIVKITEKLDELIPLNLRLTERNNKIQNIIFNHIGDLMIEVNRKATHSINNYETFIATSRRFGVTAIGDSNNEVGYNFQNVKLLNVEEISTDKFEAHLNLEVLINYQDQKAADDYSIFRLPPIYRRGTKFFDIEVECDLNNKNFNIISVNTSFI